MNAETTKPPPCQDPGCGRWVRLATPMNLGLAGWVLQQMPEGSAWVYGPAENPALLRDHLNIHIPHDWQVPDGYDELEGDEEDGHSSAGAGHDHQTASEIAQARAVEGGGWEPGKPVMWIWPDQQPGRP